MSYEAPTLKIRVQLNDYVSLFGRGCQEVARELVSTPDITVLDSEWGREPTKWRETGGWGRPRLSERDRGYLDALREIGDDLPPSTRTTLRIIEGLVG